MKIRWLVAAILCLAACRKDDRAEKLAALDSAYQSGVISKAEYDAKRQVLGGASAPAARTPAPAPRREASDKPSPLAPPPRPAGALPQTPPARAVPVPPPPPLAGCDDIRSDSGKVKGVQERFYPAPIETVKKAARDALESLDFNLHSDSGNEMEASKRRHIGAIVGAGGERLILHFEKSRQGTVVTGETKKSFVGHLAQKSWSNAILAQIACHLSAAH